MKNYLFSALLIFAISVLSCTGPSSDNSVKIMAYYFPRFGNFNPETLPLDKLTHIIYSFTEVIDNEMKFVNDTSGMMLKLLVAEKKNHPHLKVMIACGGWGGSGGFSEMSRTTDTRKKFVESVVRFIEEYKLDGLDIDWEYPGMEGIGNPYIPEDRENFSSLMQELRAGLDQIGKDQILTFAVAGWEEFFNHVELDKVMPAVTYMNVMSYDLAGGDDSYSTIREKREDTNGFVRHWNPVAKAPFLYNATDSIFISYEDTVSIRLKTEYAIKTGLGGIMFWSLGGDAPKDGLVDAIYAAKMKSVN
jgi:GH18 family chitinase